MGDFLRRPNQETGLLLVNKLDSKPLTSVLSWEVHGIQMTPTAPTSSVPDLAKHYLQLVRSHQPEGPIHLAGYSFGAMVAFEMSLQLEAENCSSLGSLSLLDGSQTHILLTHA